MKNIILLCAAGMSTSILVRKIREAAKAEQFDCTVDAYPVADFPRLADSADCVLLGPQVRFELDSVKKIAKCPCESIDMMAYGLMDGKKVLKQAKQLMGV
ncbi:MAG: PTS sugar transporter subunit IIB [Erysipelotrichaceae bacterium]